MKNQVITAENLAEILRLERAEGTTDNSLVYIMLAAALVVGIVAGAGGMELRANSRTNNLEDKPNRHQECSCYDRSTALFPEIDRRALPVNATLGNSL